MNRQIRFFFILLTVLLSACGEGALETPSNRQAEVTFTPFMPSAPTQTPQMKEISIQIDGSVPVTLAESVQFADGILRAEDGPADVLFTADRPERLLSNWVYALVAPFPTVIDGISLEDLKSVWHGETLDAMQGQPLLMDEITKNVLSVYWAEEPGALVQTMPVEEIIDFAWQAKTAWAIVPFEHLEPRWKVLRVDGVSPYDKNFSISGYPLTIPFGLKVTGETNIDDLNITAVATNRDESEMTSLLMTGVTALTRATGKKMETEGMLYPARDTIGWFESADLVHISNEVSFSDTCPPANPSQPRLQFCSRPEYLQLLEYIGVDIMELSGNHLMDWGWAAFNQSMQYYRERGWNTYSAGSNQEEARQALLMEHNGNKLAFIACNPAGPERVWATAEFPGVATCDYDWMATEISRLKEQGYMVIATQQFFESYGFAPGAEQIRVFNLLADAGAVIVSGSQAHHPQGMVFSTSGSFIHYGLGNLFFDQMRMPDGTAPEFFSADLPIAGVRLEFLDRHIFYRGKYLGTDLLTAVLEDYARPRPMTDEERAIFLRESFFRSGWK